jgi:predicted DNA-binding WGR domain protein
MTQDPNEMVNEFETLEQQQAQMTRNFELTGHCGTFPEGDCQHLREVDKP